MNAHPPPFQTHREPAGETLPLVGEDRGNRPMWIGLGVILLCGSLLLIALETRRSDRIAPAVKPKLQDYATLTSTVPELYVPMEPIYSPRAASGTDQRPYLLPSPKSAAFTRNLLPQKIGSPQFVPSSLGQGRAPTTQLQLQPPPPFQNATLDQPPPNPGLSSPVIVFDGSGAGADSGPIRAQNVSGAAYALPTAAYARAARTGNNYVLIRQGTLIPAVLETAIDSTQPGQLRALVIADVYNMRGDRVLIPKGSRLFGEYRGELAAGQKRAQVQWGVLIRPDGATIALDSPATDQLGRAGIGGRVNAHFFERLGGALLQSSIDIAAISASRAISGSAVIFGVPTSVQGATSQLAPQAPKPTLRVRQGTSISVLVARDLDFSAVEASR